MSTKTRKRTNATIPETIREDFGFPDEVLEIDETFNRKYKDAIQAAKKEYENQGGIYTLHDEDHDYGVIVRVPNRDIMRDVTKRAQNLEPMEADMLLVGKCLIYPKPQVVEAWINGPAPGLAMTFCKDLLKLAKVEEKSSVKKL